MKQLELGSLDNVTAYDYSTSQLHSTHAHTNYLNKLDTSSPKADKKSQLQILMQDFNQIQT